MQLLHSANREEFKFSALARLGGTMVGEHGDGRLRAPLLETIWGPEIVASFRAVKDAFDPLGILNPGVILPLPGQRPLDAIKYQ
ncbi:MAG TPA: FAD-linked oxidase C-terminal domain-containing protein [Longimicrobium sp.]|nr:FAD-linked oxidase C-terminal domain-containing protein [Longimicrobium sp.]